MEAGAHHTGQEGWLPELLQAAVGESTFHPAPSALKALRSIARAARGIMGTGVLAAAISSGAPPAALRILLEEGCDPQDHRGDGAPAIVVAAKRRDAAAVDVLLLAGADPDSADTEGRTPLMHAVERDDMATMTTLLAGGADLQVRAADGSTAHDLARAWGRSRARSMFGDRFIGPELLERPRTVIQLRPSEYRAIGDQHRLAQWALVIEHALEEFGEDEFRILTGYAEDEARHVVEILTDDAAPQELGGGLRSVPLTAANVGVIRGALLNVAYGPPMLTSARAQPDGRCRHVRGPEGLPGLRPGAPSTPPRVSVGVSIQGVDCVLHRLRCRG